MFGESRFGLTFFISVPLFLLSTVLVFNPAGAERPPLLFEVVIFLAWIGCGVAALVSGCRLVLAVAGALAGRVSALIRHAREEAARRREEAAHRLRMDEARRRAEEAQARTEQVRWRE